MTGSAVDLLGDIERPNSYWIGLMRQAGEQALEIERTYTHATLQLAMKKAKERARISMELSIRGKPTSGLRVKRTIDRLLRELLEPYRIEVAAYFRARRINELRAEKDAERGDRQRAKTLKQKKSRGRAKGARRGSRR